MNDLRLSIRQTYAEIGIQTTPTRQQMQSPPGELQIEQPPARMEFSKEPAKLGIDSSQAQHALMMGPNLEWSSYVNGQMKEVFLQQLGRMVEEGARMAQITNPRNAFADLAREHVFRRSQVDYRAVSPGYDNVRVHYDPGAVHTDIQAFRPEIQYTPHKPDIQTQQGKTEIYLRQKNSIQISVSTYDLYR
ncbi:DUF6470 family protein [Cohnella thermotolerans]|uniref:DUF6470 family protein n=1 Tax=Cohnella thermotolerans TaxID=329858 RepID=UPI000422C35D|nr:DUF6470 family protein [Cohnella thermotolerans]